MKIKDLIEDVPWYTFLDRSNLYRRYWEQLDQFVHEPDNDIPRMRLLDSLTPLEKTYYGIDNE